MRFPLFSCWECQSESEICHEHIENETQPMSEHLPILPDELIANEILHRLPAKSVGRFRCVSKQWRSLLSSPQFVQSHLDFHTQYPQHLVFIDHCPCGSRPNNSCYVLTFNRSSSFEDGVLKKLTYPLEKDRFFQVGGSCRGLVVINVGIGSTKVLMNPITLEASRVTNCPPDRMSVYGLGYDRCSDDHKIVNVTPNLGRGSAVVDVYSVRMKCWRKLPNSRDCFRPYLHFDRACHGNGVFVSGCIHWMGTDNRNNGGRIVICAFDLAREEFEEVQPPRGVDLGEDRFLIKVLRGCLALVSKSYCSSVVVWLMKEYGERDSWTKLAISGPEDYGNVGYEVVSLMNEDEVVLTESCERLVVYNCTSGVWRDMVVAGVPLGWMRAVAVGESLVSPNYL